MLVSVDRDGTGAAETWQALALLQGVSVSSADLVESVVFTNGGGG
jgi:hypothetical protein